MENPVLMSALASVGFSIEQLGCRLPGCRTKWGSSPVDDCVCQFEKHLLDFRSFLPCCSIRAQGSRRDLRVSKPVQGGGHPPAELPSTTHLRYPTHIFFPQRNSWAQQQANDYAVEKHCQRQFECLSSYTQGSRCLNHVCSTSASCLAPSL